MFEIGGVRFSRERWSLVSELGRPARVCKGPEGMDVYELTETGGEIHATTFYTWTLRFDSLEDLLTESGYQVVA